MTLPFLKMPVNVRYTGGWTFNEVFGTTSYVRQFFEDLFRIRIQADVAIRRDPDLDENLNMSDDFEWKSLGGGEFRPVCCLFVESISRYGLSRGLHGSEEDLGGATRGNVAALDRTQLAGRFGRGCAFEFCKTMGHELGHTLELHHYSPQFTVPNLMASEGTRGQRPSWKVNDVQVNHARKEGLKFRRLLY